MDPTLSDIYITIARAVVLGIYSRTVVIGDPKDHSNFSAQRIEPEQYIHNIAFLSQYLHDVSW